MNRKVSFIIPSDPQGKGRARSNSRGITYTPAKTRNHEAFIKMLAMEAMKGAKPFDGYICSEIIVFYKVPASSSNKIRERMLANKIRPDKKPDVDNILKSIYDACNGIVFVDDKQVVSERTDKYYGEVAQTLVIIAEIGRSDDP